MHHSSLWRRSAVVCAFLAVLVVGLAASNSLDVWGYNSVYQNLGAHAAANTGGSLSQMTFTKVRVEGFAGAGRSCGSGSVNGDWCEGSDNGWGQSQAYQKVDVVPQGWISGSSVHFIDHNAVESTTKTVFVEDHTGDPPPSDGCDTDPAQSHCSPILIDLTPQPSDRYRLSSADDGVLFDLDADGDLEQTAWVTNGQNVAFLALDRDGNGMIDNGSELIGNYTLPGVSNGFAALALLEAHNRDGVIDARDPLFAKLLLWRDANRNGVSEPRELEPAYKVLEAVGLGYYRNERVDQYGNEYRFTGFARRLRPGANGLAKRPAGVVVEDDPAREFPIYDVFFAVRN